MGMTPIVLRLSSSQFNLENVAQFLKRLGYALAILCIVGCRPWPPSQDELTSQFRRHEQALKQIHETVESEELSSVFFSPGANSVKVEVISPNGEYDRVKFKADLSAKLHSLMKEARVDSVFLSSEKTHFNLREIDSRGFLYSISFVRSSQKDWAMPCEEFGDVPSEGMCAIQLDATWWIAYSWHTNP